MPSISAPAQAGMLFPHRPSFGANHADGEILDLIDMLPDGVLPASGDVNAGGLIWEALGGGRSGAHIFKIMALTGPGGGQRDAPVVVKISPRDAGAREKANYEQFVRPLLPATCRPDLRGFAEADGRAALCYSFLGEGDRPETLTNLIAMGELETLDIALSALFETLHSSWYGPRLIEAETDLASYYLARYFEHLTAAAEAEKKLFGQASRYFGAGPRAKGYSIRGIAFPSICGTLFTRWEKRAYRSCILHGDLNSDNVIIHRNRGIAGLVDFERTGRGHALQDLVSLEASIRINYPPDAAPSDILEIERAVTLGEHHTCASPYAMAISGIRDAARRFFGPDEATSNYHFAVAAVGLRLMKATDLSDTARARISASALWAAKMLVEHGE